MAHRNVPEGITVNGQGTLLRVAIHAIHHTEACRVKVTWLAARVVTGYGYAGWCSCGWAIG